MIGHYNLTFEIAGVLMLSILLFFLVLQYEMPTEQSRAFRNLITFTLLAELLDVLSAYVTAQPEVYDNDVLSLLNMLYFCASFWAEYYLVRYVLLPARKEDLVLRALYANKMLLAVSLLIALSSPVTGAIFEVTDLGIYLHGPLYFICYVLPCVYIVEAMVVVALHGTYFSRAEFTTIVAFAVVEGLALLLQAFFFRNTLLTFFGASLGAFILFFGLETPDYRKMVFAVEQLEKLKGCLEEEVRRQVKLSTARQERIEKLSLETVWALADAINAKDVYTQGHSMRVAIYSAALAYSMGWDSAEIEDLFQAAVLHDIGKIGIKDSVLNKPGKLTDEEFEEIKMHTVRGAQVLENVTSYPAAKVVARSHHERWDGKGYPDGLVGEEIPLMARLVAIADSYDAMNSERVYRKPLSREVIREELVKGSDVQFDPVVLAPFIKMLDDGTLDYLNQTFTQGDEALGPVEITKLFKLWSANQ